MLSLTPGRIVAPVGSEVLLVIKVMVMAAVNNPTSTENHFMSRSLMRPATGTSSAPMSGTATARTAITWMLVIGSPLQPPEALGAEAVVMLVGGNDQG